VGRRKIELVGKDHWDVDATHSKHTRQNEGGEFNSKDMGQGRIRPRRVMQQNFNKISKTQKEINKNNPIPPE